MKTANVGQYLFNSILPKEYRDNKRNFHNPKMLNDLLTRMARELPSGKYRDVLRDIFKLGADITYYEGSSFSLEDLKIPQKTKEARSTLSSEVNQILANPNFSRKEKNAAVIAHVQKSIKGLNTVMMAETKSKDSGLAKQVQSGSRGNAGDLQSLLLGDMLMEDAKGNAIPIPLLHGYAEGVDPAEYFSNSFGTRMGVLSTKKSVADSGYLCLALDTKVRMADGSSKSIQDISCGDVVTGADKYGNTFPTTVTNVFDNGLKEINEYTFRRGRSRVETFTIRATKEHKVLGRLARGTEYSTYGEMRPLSDASMYGFNLVSHRPFLDSTAGFKDEPMAWITGQIIGDGCTTGSGITWSCNDQEYIDRMDTEVKKFGCLLNKIKNHPFEYQIAVDPESRHVLLGDNGKTYQNPIRKRLDEMGLLGKLAHQKKVPLEAYTWTNESVFRLIEGLIESDGCVTEAKTKTSSQPSVVLSMTSEETVRSVADLLGWRLGIWVTVSKSDPLKTLSKNSVSTLGHHPMFTFVASHRESMVRIMNNILIHGGRKAEHLEELLSKYNAKQGLGNQSCKFISEVPLGLTRTYDIEVDNPDHLFVLANGAIVSNSKRMKQVAHRQVVTQDDCGTLRSIEVNARDPENIGAVLAEDAGDYKIGTPITASVLKRLKGDKIRVRSALTCDAPEGLCAKCVGIRESGEFPSIGDNIGIIAGQSVGEKATQKALSAKHSAGRATGNVKGSFVEGYDLIEQLMSVPRSFTDAAVTSNIEGTVELIEPAPQGGQHITIDGKVFHVPSHMDPIVKKGDDIEPGDLLSNGIPDPSKMIKYKGIGETRRIFTDQLKEATGASRRNTEVMAKAFVDYIRITEPDLYPNTAPDDVMKYSELAKTWKPRKGFRTLAPRASVGQYLETPVAQYTIGTRVTPKVANELSRRGFKKIDTHQDEPPFEPIMVPSVRALTHSDDWQERMGGYHLKDSLLDAASRGMESQVHSTSFIPGILKGTDFGETLRETGTY